MGRRAISHHYRALSNRIFHGRIRDGYAPYGPTPRRAHLIRTIIARRSPTPLRRESYWAAEFFLRKFGWSTPSTPKLGNPRNTRRIRRTMFLLGPISISRISHGGDILRRRELYALLRKIGPGVLGIYPYARIDRHEVTTPEHKRCNVAV